MSPRAKMTGWYDPVRLLAIGIRVAEATVFGKMFDRRELIAALARISHTIFARSRSFARRLDSRFRNAPARGAGDASRAGILSGLRGGSKQLISVGLG